MNDAQDAVKALIEGVVALSESTRGAAAHGAEEFGRIEQLEECAERVRDLVANLRAAVNASGPPPALPSERTAASAPSAEVVESLDELFGS